jgi:hypothetical protein
MCQVGRSPALATVMEAVILRQVRFFLSDPYASAFYETSLPGWDDGPNKEQCPPTHDCPKCHCSHCTPTYVPPR